MRTVDSSTLARVAARLANPANARPAASFPHGHQGVDQPGLYSWWADAHAREVIGSVLEADIPPLIYAGQAGATRWPSGKMSTATLSGRISGNHLNGNASSSTFRLTISALLLEPLGLAVARPGRLIPADRLRVSAWMKEHLCLATFPFDDRDALEHLESHVLGIIDPPLNLRGMAATPVRSRLSTLRRRITAP